MAKAQDKTMPAKEPSQAWPMTSPDSRDHARELDQAPPVFCHRDYQVRNLMVRDNTLYVIDFQDARMGNVYYDLCSLLRDSYVTLPEKVVDELVYTYRHSAPAKLRQKGGDPASFPYHLDISALQRNIKAIGTFGNQAHNLGKRFYLRFIPPTVAHLSANFDRNPRMKPLARRLLPVLSELAEKAAAGAPP